MDDNVAAHLAAACSRSGLHPEAFFPLCDAFPNCKLMRLSFGLQNKVMLSVTVCLEEEGRTHASYVPIHPTAAAAAVLQNNPVVVVRQDKRSPLWDQEDLYQREGCSTLSVVSMPFYWPPRQGAQWEGAPLPVPQNAAFHPTFGALTAAGDVPLTQEAMQLLMDLAARTGRHVGPHISMLLSALEGAGLLPTEADAQEELGLGEEEEEREESMDDLFDFEDAQLNAAMDGMELLPGLAPSPGSVAASPPQPPSAASTAAAAAAADGPSASTPPSEWRLSGAGQPQAPAPQPPQQLGSGQQEQQREQEQRQAEGPSGDGRGEGAGTAADPGLAHSLRDQHGQQQQQASAAPSAGHSRQVTPTTRAGLDRSAAGTPFLPGSGMESALLASVAGSPAAVALGGSPAALGFQPWHSLAFQQDGLEQAFATHYSRRQERADIATLAVLALGLLAAAAAHLQAAWSAGMGAMLLFTPYFIDARLYQHLREALLSGAVLLMSVFVASIARQSTPLMRGPGSCSASALGSSMDGPAGGTCGGDRALMAGFGICWFVVHTCGLDYLLVAPLLMRLRTSRALPVQAASLAFALYRLPSVYVGVLGRLDTVHVLLLGLLLVAGAAAGLVMGQLLERRQREAWLAGRRRRGAATVAASI